ncbi:MAG TPA: acyl-CoA dehydrogenase [Desulfomonilia bacterium]|nr:acyl-CoA dehydrogenase [Deltaproteobacteria bacterium]HRS55924.1 acyl-CoA dehydrogenase [Desulfomonilia bacterium]
MDLSLYAREGEREFVELTRSFVRKSVQPLFGDNAPDGDLGMVPSILDTAFEVGLAASPHSGMPGFEYGIWGTSADNPEGVRLSAILLSVVAEACPGIAMNLHVQGLASRIITSSKGSFPEPPVRVATALQEGHTLPGFRAVLGQGRGPDDGIGTRALPTEKGWAITGTKSFVYSMEKADAFLVFCRIEGRSGKEDTGCLLVPADATGLKLQDIGGRTGIRACRLSHLILKDVEVSSECRFLPADDFPLMGQALCLHWLGISAMAAGNASGALKAAREYAATRYQGGAMIEEHPAVRKLLALSEARVEAAFALLVQTCSFAGGNTDFLRRCAIAKLMTTDWAFSAVTDALQVFGGYGYMEDYCMEKRLRDAIVLKSAAGSRNYLEAFISDAARGEI